MRLQFLCFQLGARLFAVDLASVREILRKPKITPVPQAPRHIDGVVNLRGNLVPVVDMHTVLAGTNGTESTEDSKLLVMKVKGRTAGLLVDQVIDVCSVPLESLIPVPTSKGSEPPVVIAAYRRDGDGGDVVLLVRVSPLLQEAERASWIPEEVPLP